MARLRVTPDSSEQLRSLLFQVEVFEALSKMLGLGLAPKELSLLQVCLRGIIVFLTAVVMVRLADRRFLAKLTTLDAILAFILGSTLARAINGSAAFFPTLGVGFV
jgi:hypothetical protein